MKQIIFFCVFVISFVCSVAQAAPARIVSLAPNVTEILFVAGAGKDVVGVSSYSNYPSQAKRLPVVATATSVDVEKIVALKPTLVVAWKNGTSPLAVAALVKNHIPVYWLRVNSMQDIARNIKVLGRFAKTGKVAKLAAHNFLLRYSVLKKQYAHKKRISVFYQISNQPLMTIGHSSVTNQLIQDCGGYNIFRHTYGAAPQVNLASILAKQPQAIIISNPEYGDTNFINAWKKWPQLLAVKRNNIFKINSSIIDRPGPRLTQGMAALCQDLQVARNRLKKENKI